jgi:hypothetical protein
MRRASLALVLVALASALGGCVVPLWWGPGFTGATRENLPESGPTFITVGSTTREDVLLALGEPDGEAADQSWFAYGSAWTKGGGGAFVFVGAPGGIVGGALGSERVVFRRLLLRFDAQGRVADSQFETQACRLMSGWGFINERSGTADPTPCLDVDGADLRTADAIAAALSPGAPAPPRHRGKWWPDERTRWTAPGHPFVEGTVLFTDTELLFFPPPGYAGPLPPPVRVAFADVAEVRYTDFHTKIQLIRRDGTRESFVFDEALREAIAARVPVK